MRKKGIDVSEFQRSIDWEKAKEYIDFAIIRCGYGNNLPSQDDPYYHINAEACTRLHIPFGVYLFSYATNMTMAESEVEHTLRLIKDYKLEYPVFLDVEDRSQLELPKEELTNIVKFYCEKLEEAGYYVGIYASLNTFTNYLNSEELNKFDKWVAEWNKDFTYRGSSGMWQNTDNERIEGINTRVDGDIAFLNYPEIIRENGLNHLDNELPKRRKYKVGDRLFLNGPLYETKEGRRLIRTYKNKLVTVEEVIEEENIVAPYRLNIGGYAKERDLDTKRKTNTCFHLIDFIINLILGSE